MEQSTSHGCVSLVNSALSSTGLCVIDVLHATAAKIDSPYHGTYLEKKVVQNRVRPRTGLKQKVDKILQVYPACFAILSGVWGGPANQEPRSGAA